MFAIHTGGAGGGFAATHCNTLQHTATHCDTLQHTATRTGGICCRFAATHQQHCNSLHYAAPYCTIRTILHRTAPHCITPQHTATLQHTATHTGGAGCGFAWHTHTHTHRHTHIHTQVEQAVDLLGEWEKLSTIDMNDALQLLSAQFTHPKVRMAAARSVAIANDQTLVVAREREKEGQREKEWERMRCTSVKRALYSSALFTQEP